MKLLLHGIRLRYGIRFPWCIRSLLALCLCACGAETRATPQPFAVTELPPHIRIGEPILRLTGGELDAPVDVPMWLDLREAAQRQFSCEVTWDYRTLPLPDGRIYVELSSMCVASECRVLDPTTRAFSEPTGGCLDTGIWTGARVRVAGDWLVVHASSEGVGEMFLQRYSPETGSQILLTLPLETEFETRVFEDGEAGLRFEVGCPSVGRVTERHGSTFDWAPSNGLLRVGARRACPDV